MAMSDRILTEQFQTDELTQPLYTICRMLCPAIRAVWLEGDGATVSPE